MSLRHMRYMCAGDDDVVARQAAAREFEQLRAHISLSLHRGHGLDVDLAGLFAGLLRARELYSLTTLKVEKCTLGCVDVLTEVLRTSSIVLEAVSPNPQDSGETPFLGPAKWIGVRFHTLADRHVISPALQTLTNSTALLSMLSLLASQGVQNLVDTSARQVRVASASGGDTSGTAPLSLLHEVMRVIRNCVLLGTEQCVEQGRAMLPVLLQWLRGASPSVRIYLGQVLGILCLQLGSVSAGAADHNSDGFVSQVWRVLLLKVKEDNFEMAKGALSCMTAVVESLACECNAVAEINSGPSGRDASVEGEGRVLDLARILMELLLSILSASAEGMEGGGEELQSALRSSALDALQTLGTRGFFSCGECEASAVSQQRGDPFLCCSLAFSGKLAGALGRSQSELLSTILERCETLLHDPFRRHLRADEEEKKRSRAELSSMDMSNICSALGAISAIVSSGGVPRGRVCL